MNARTSRGSPGGAVDHFSTEFTSWRSNHRMSILSRCHTPVVHIASGPRELCTVSSVLFSVAAEGGSATTVRLLREYIRLAMTMSVNMRSPTITSSWSATGVRKDEKYVRTAAMQE